MKRLDSVDLQDSTKAHRQAASASEARRRTMYQITVRDIRLWRKLSGLADGGAEQWPLRFQAIPSAFQLVLAGHLVDLAVLLVEPYLPAFFPGRALANITGK